MSELPTNQNVVLIVGKPNAGKTSCLYNLEDQDQYIYLNCDRKEITFPHKFRKDIWIHNPKEVLGYIDLIEKTEGVRGAVIDTLTILMSEYVRCHIMTLPPAKRLSGWGDLSTFYNEVMHKIKSGTKDYIIIGHLESARNDATGSVEDRVPIQGSIGKKGCESDFSYILTAKMINDIPMLQTRESEYLNIDEDDVDEGFKRVFMTRPYQGEGNLSRAPMFFWGKQDLYIDTNVGAVLQRIKEWRAGQTK